jgi:hypothetical protein
MLSLKQQPHATLGTEFTGPDGNAMILLKPEMWIGKEFPLVSRFVEPECSEILMKGTWTVLLIQTDCSDCKQMMADLAGQNAGQKAKRIALVVVPSRPNEKIPDTPFPTFWLDRQNDWFVTTPCAIKLSEGICVEIGKRVAE